MAWINEYLLFGLLLYFSVGMMIPVLIPKIMKEFNLVGFHLPDEHVMFVCLVMLAWPAIFWIRRRYKYKVLAKKRNMGYKELRELIKLATKSASQQ